jgi:hypothetical protein
MGFAALYSSYPKTTACPLLVMTIVLSLLTPDFCISFSNFSFSGSNALISTH